MKYIAISGLSSRDKLFSMSLFKLKQFENLFGKFDHEWNDHEGALEWIQNNCKFVDYCTCVA
jgi:hypothetical protein